MRIRKNKKEYNFEERQSDPQNPYELDYLYDAESKIQIPALTKKNSLFLEAVIRLDSNYGNDVQSFECGKNFLTVLNDDTNFSQKPGNDNYVGSTIFWFESMRDNSQICGKDVDFSVYLKGALHNINLTNSTRCSKKSINKVAEELSENCKSAEELRELLCQPFSKDNQQHIISILTRPTEEGDKNKLSLASKFCAYATEYLFGDMDFKPLYPKYDGVVSSNLHYYFYYYCTKLSSVDIPDNYGTVLNRNFKANMYLKPDAKFNDYMSIYEAYSWCIARILETVCCLNASELDHIIWYCKK